MDSVTTQKTDLDQSPFPPESEQCAIAEALSEVDGLLAALEALLCLISTKRCSDGLWLRFPFSAAYQAADSSAGSATTPKTSQEQEKTREKILVLIAADPSITTGELANRLGITTKGVEWQIRKLKQKGFLERIGPAKGGHWKVVETKDE